jgi:hypothetical protein
MNKIEELALESYPEKWVTVGDNRDQWDENKQYRECWIEGYNKSNSTLRKRETLEAYAKIVSEHYAYHFFADAIEESINHFLAEQP